MTQPQDEAPPRQQWENEADGHKPIKPTPAQEAGMPETPHINRLRDTLLAAFRRYSRGEVYLTDLQAYLSMVFRDAAHIEKDRDRLRASLAAAERERDEANSALARSELALCYANDDRDKLRADLAAAQKERDDLIAQLHVIFTELKKIPCLQGEGPRKGYEQK